jgi:uncharacterized membrane-anchored protein
MRKWPILAAVLFQALVLAYMAGERELTLHTGQIIFLRTSPVDPQDIFRGDYISLSYEISTIGPRYLRAGLKGYPGDTYVTNRQWRDRRVYVSLDLKEDGLAELEYASDKRPPSGLFVQGRLERSWGKVLTVRYGLEAYFVQQGKGLEIERNRMREGMQIPLEMEVAVSKEGLTVLKGYRWSPLGIGLTLETDKQRRVHAAQVRLLNASDKDLAIVDFPNGRSFALEPASALGWMPAGNQWFWVNATSAQPTVTDEFVHVLKTGAEYSFRMDFENPAWLVQGEKGELKPLSALTWGARFRLVYRPPSKPECAGLKSGGLIWHGTLPSRAFSGGNVD